MKLIFLVFALIGASCVGATLRDDFNELEAMIPVDKIHAIYEKYQNDPDIVKIRAYLHSDDFAAVAHIVANVPEVQDIVSYLESKEIKAVEFINKLADLLGLPHWPGSFHVRSHPRQTRTWQQMADEIKAVIPMDAIVEWALDKMMNSADFQELFTKIQSVDYQKLHDNALKHPEIVDMLNRLNKMGVDTKKIWETLKSIFGWEYFAHRQSRSLRTDIDELEAMIPVEKIKAIYKKYENDPDMIKVKTYLKSAEFKTVAHIVANVPEIQDMVNYLESKGLHPIEYINKFADLVGLPHWPGSFSVYSWRHQTRSLRQMLDEIEAEIPMDQITEWALDKMMNSADFQELFEKVQNLPYQQLHDNALKHPEIVDMLERINKLGVDTKKIWETLKSIFGWE